VLLGRGGPYRLVALTFGALLAPEFAHAQEPPVPTGVATAPASRPSRAGEPPQGLTKEPLQRWYGAQVLLADAVPVALLVLSFPANEDLRGLLFTLGAPSFLVTGPAVHLHHRRPGAALGSFVLRSSLPIAGLLVGASNGRECPPPDVDYVQPCKVDGSAMAAGGFVGVVLASLLDATALSAATDAPPQRMNPNALRVDLAPHGDGLILSAATNL
jgi:hypothetical protein